MKSFSINKFRGVALPALFVSILLVYQEALNNQFIWDSRYYLIDNPYLTDLTIKNLHWVFTTDYTGYWHPLAWLSYMIDYKIYGGLDTRGFHLSNIILHGVNCVILFFLIVRLLKLHFELNLQQPDMRIEYASFVGTLLFALHPIHTETVVWVAERKNILVSIFILLTIFSYISYSRAEVTHKLKFYLLTIIFFCLALLAKPVAVTVPALLLILDIYPLKRLQSMRDIFSHTIVKLVREKAILILLSIVMVLHTLYSQSNSISSSDILPLGLRIVHAFDAAIFYIQKSLIPLSLSPLYPHPFFTRSDVSYENYLSIFACISIFTITIIQLLQRKYAFFICWLFFLVALSPNIGIIQAGIQGTADRYAYISTLPFYVIISALCYSVLNKKQLRSIFLIAYIAIVTVFTSFTLQQIYVWRSPVSAWSTVVSIFPDSGPANSALAASLYGIGDYSNAVKRFDRAILAKGLSPSYLSTYALSLLRVNRTNDAIKIYQVLINKYRSTINDDILMSCMQFNLGLAYLNTGYHDLAKTIFSQAKDHYPPADKLLLMLAKKNRIDNFDDIKYCTTLRAKFSY